MASIKTAISIEAPLYAEVEKLAQEMNVSRSQVYAIAIRDFLERHKNRKLLAELNKAYQGGAGVEEEQARDHMKAVQRRMAQGKW